METEGGVFYNGIDLIGAGSSRIPTVGLSGISLDRTPIGANVGTTPTAGLTGELRLQLGQADIVRPLIGGDRGPVRAAIVGAIDQQAANAGGSHFGEGDLLAGQGDGHVSILGRPVPENLPSKLSNYLASARRSSAAIDLPTQRPHSVFGDFRILT